MKYYNQGIFSYITKFFYQDFSYRIRFSYSSYVNYNKKEKRNMNCQRISPIKQIIFNIAKPTQYSIIDPSQLTDRISSLSCLNASPKKQQINKTGINLKVKQNHRQFLSRKISIESEETSPDKMKRLQLIKCPLESLYDSSFYRFQESKIRKQKLKHEYSFVSSACDLNIRDSHYSNRILERIEKKDKKIEKQQRIGKNLDGKCACQIM